MHPPLSLTCVVFPVQDFCRSLIRVRLYPPVGPIVLDEKNIILHDSATPPKTCPYKGGMHAKPSPRLRIILVMIVLIMVIVVIMKNGHNGTSHGNNKALGSPQYSEVMVIMVIVMATIDPWASGSTQKLTA